jgi:ABC-type multidrug transport system fused ATPase/permease subunit
MTAWIALAIVSVLLSLLAGWFVPAWTAKRFVAAQEADGRAIDNFRGNKVVPGLGLAWLAWAVGVAVLSNLIAFGSQLITNAIQSAGALPQDWWSSVSFAPFSTATHVVPVLLVVGAGAFGLADDVFGGSGDKGFSGHFRALRSGRLSTGMLKMLGIGALSFVTATSIASTIDTADPMVAASTGWVHAVFVALTWIAATLVIGLTANLLNLTDVRPGRALKSYIPLALVGIGLCMWGFWEALQKAIIASAAAYAAQGAAYATPGLPSGPEISVWGIGSVVCLLLIVLGPVIALWRYDLGERAMLGDAGANAMGVVAGYLLVRSAPLWLLGVFALLMLALNLLSEKVSFTAVIQRVKVLAWLDGLGRTP